MKLLLGFLMAMPLLSFGQSNREIQENRVLENLRITRQTVQANLQRNSLRDLQKIDRLLDQVKEVSLGIDTDPRPWPLPPQRVPVCIEDEASYAQQTFIKIKAFAYSGSGPNLSSSAATDYATQWSQKYPCDLANKFIADYTRIRAFAYAGNGLNLSSSSSVDYANNMISRLCVHVNMEAIYAKDYNFAYSGAGLNLSSSGAHAYARPRMEAQAFVCRNL